jgi:hypothetical protein
MKEKTWVIQLLETAKLSWGAHIHATNSKWMYYKINVGTQIAHNQEYASLSKNMLCTLNMVAQQCIETALNEVCEYNTCVRTPSADGAVWTLLCMWGRAQAVHKDGHARYTKVDAPDDICFNYFLNITVPLIGDIPTLCRGPDIKLRGFALCTPNQIRIFNGGVRHAGAANISGNDVWELFSGLMPAKNPTAGETPVFEDCAGKSIGKYKDRLILASDDSR